MKTVFNHYYLFTQNVINGGLLTIKAKVGYYAPLETESNAITKMVITFSQPTYLLKESEPKTLLNPFKVRWAGLAHFHHYQDTIIVVCQPSVNKVELFISENSKHQSTYLFDRFKTGEFDDQVDHLRASAELVVQPVYSNNGL